MAAGKRNTPYASGRHRQKARHARSVPRRGARDAANESRSRIASNHHTYSLRSTVAHHKSATSNMESANCRNVILLLCPAFAVCTVSSATISSPWPCTPASTASADAERRGARATARDCKMARNSGQLTRPGTTRRATQTRASTLLFGVKHCEDTQSFANSPRRARRSTRHALCILRASDGGLRLGCRRSHPQGTRCITSRLHFGRSSGRRPQTPPNTGAHQRLQAHARILCD